MQHCCNVVSCAKASVMPSMQLFPDGKLYLSSKCTLAATHTQHGWSKLNRTIDTSPRQSKDWYFSWKLRAPPKKQPLLTSNRASSEITTIRNNHDRIKLQATSTEKIARTTTAAATTSKHHQQPATLADHEWEWISWIESQWCCKNGGWDSTGAGAVVAQKLGRRAHDSHELHEMHQCQAAAGKVWNPRK